jgi:hypothetical protein
MWTCTSMSSCTHTKYTYMSTSLRPRESTSRAEDSLDGCQHEKQLCICLQSCVVRCPLQVVPHVHVSMTLCELPSSSERPAARHRVLESSFRLPQNRFRALTTRYSCGANLAKRLKTSAHHTGPRLRTCCIDLQS